jgi:hypothetical protein
MCYTLSMRKRPTLWLDAADKAAIATIQARYGAAAERDAIRLAVRLLAESNRVTIQDRNRARAREREHQP